MKYTTARDPVYTNANKSSISLLLVTDDGNVPYVVEAYDSDAFAVGIYIRAINGDFGPVADYVESLLKLKMAKLEELSTACQNSILSGYLSSALGSLHVYPSTMTDQQNMTASVTASLLPNIPDDWSTPFWVMNYESSGAQPEWSMMPHSVSQIQQAGSDGKTMIVTAQVRLVALSEAAMRATTAQAIAAVRW